MPSRHLTARTEGAERSAAWREGWARTGQGVRVGLCIQKICVRVDKCVVHLGFGTQDTTNNSHQSFPFLFHLGLRSGDQRDRVTFRFSIIRAHSQPAPNSGGKSLRPGKALPIPRIPRRYPQIFATIRFRGGAPLATSQNPSRSSHAPIKGGSVAAARQTGKQEGRSERRGRSQRTQSGRGSSSRTEQRSYSRPPAPPDPRQGRDSCRVASSHPAPARYPAGRQEHGPATPCTSDDHAAISWSGFSRDA